MQIKHVKPVKCRKKNLAFSIYSLVSIDKGSVSTKLFTLNEYEPCTQRRLSSGRLQSCLVPTTMFGLDKTKLVMHLCIDVKALSHYDV